MSKKDERYGFIGSAIIHSLLLLLLVLFGLKTLPQEEEGILVNFGDTLVGEGLEEPKESQAEEKTQTVTPPPVSVPQPAVKAPSESTTATQDYDEAPIIKSEAQKKKEKEDKEKKEELKKEQVEKERIKQEELAKQRAEEQVRLQKEAEEKRKQDELSRQKAEVQSNVKNAFSGKGTGSSSSEGDTKGDGNQGYVTGDPNSKNRVGSGLGNSGNGFSLTGRSLNGSLPKPTYSIQEEGVVVIEIIVDKDGNVTSAVPILRGSTTQNKYLQDKAVEAAKKAKFNIDKNAAAYQKGTITYKFELN